MQRKSWIVMVALLFITKNFFGFTTTSYAQTQGEVVVDSGGEPGKGNPADPPDTSKPNDSGATNNSNVLDQTGNESPSTGKVLPQTGEQTNPIPLVAGIISIMIGISIMYRKNKKA
ncbi:LPXTG cell wall anchor domain-containing protein [Brevibacillus sp. 179-C9.3 HS]|uniref:LPXTG cell wall anchor domain-containing protein n=1 Tax=unclassified Brevibacillus TaxID=2684853 RepID=UPI0039A29920